jgi:hypothetical protein
MTEDRKDQDDGIEGVDAHDGDISRVTFCAFLVIDNGTSAWVGLGSAACMYDHIALLTPANAVPILRFRASEV